MLTGPAAPREAARLCGTGAPRPCAERHRGHSIAGWEALEKRPDPPCCKRHGARDAPGSPRGLTQLRGAAGMMPPSCPHLECPGTPRAEGGPPPAPSPHPLPRVQATVTDVPQTGGSRDTAPTSPAGGRDSDTEGPGVWRGLPGPRAPAAPTFCPRVAGQGTAPPTAPSPPRHPLRRPSRQGSGFHTRVWEGRRRSVHGHQNFLSTYPKVRRRVTSVFTAFKTQSHRAASEGDQAFDAITPSPRRLLLQTPLRPVHDAHSPHRSPQPAGPGRLPADAALTPGPAGPSCWGALVCLQRPGTPSSPRLTTVTVHRGRSSATPLELRLPDSLSLPSPTLLCPIADRTWPVLDAPCQARRGLGVDSAWTLASGGPATSGSRRRLVCHRRQPRHLGPAGCSIKGQGAREQRADLGPPPPGRS